MRLAALFLLARLSAAQSAGAIDPIFQDYNHPGVPGASVLVVRDGKVLYKHSYGMADLEAHVAAAPDTNYRLASVTKQFTAMAILMLRERGLLSLDDPLTRFFPDYPAYGRAVTVRHLLTHTSGLKAYEELMPAGQTVQLKDRDVLKLLEAETSGYFAPGSDWRYSNTGYAHLALIVEKVSGMTFAAFLKKNIFDPLGMDGSVAFEDGISTVPHRAYGYSAHGSSFERTDQSPTSAVLGDGGIYSSIEDLYKWDQALYTRKLAPAATLQMAFTPAVVTSGKPTNYGFGWEIGNFQGRRMVHHNGSTIGFRNEILRLPDEKLTVIVLTNRNGGNPAELAARVAALYLH